jgi:release factor glutamine methyltransferase
MYTKMQHTPFTQLSEDLTPLYGEGEARSIARIVIQDAFKAWDFHSFLCTTQEQTSQLEQISNQLLQGEPVQYVLGQADFFGLKFKVTPAVLIPRQETEELVAAVLEIIPKNHPPLRLLDIGLGTGCIGITLKYKRPGVQLFGFEKSPEALLIAETNATQILGAGKVHFSLTDILTQQPAIGEQYDIIVSNPPYIPRHEATLMPRHVLEHEPEMALFVDHEDPLLFYRVIAEYARLTLLPGGALFFECNEFNASEVAPLLTQLHFEHVHLRKDLNGADRIVHAVYSH